MAFIKHGYCLAGKLLPSDSSDKEAERVDTFLFELELLKNAGYHFAEIDAGTLLSFSDNEIGRLKNAALPIEVCNCFIPGKYQICDPAQRPEICEYAKSTLKRAKELGISIMVFGSGAARRIPEGMTPEEGTEHIAAFLKDCNSYAEENNITIVIEPLNHNECNILLTVREAARLVRRLNLSHIKLLADTYHMSIDSEMADAVWENIDIIEHIHIAEDITRGYPGSGESKLIREVAQRLKAGVYTKRVTVECKAEDWKREIMLSKSFMNSCL